MPDERESPSGGWREVYDEMDAETTIEDATLRCPTCGRDCPNLVSDVYDCEEHGVFRASADRSDAADGSEEREDGREENGSDDRREERPDDRNDAQRTQSPWTAD